MVRYHINKKTGEVGECRADKKPCPLGETTEHYPTRELAYKAYEKMMSNSVGTFTVKSKSVSSSEYLEDKTFDDILDFANQSKKNYITLSNEINKRNQRISLLVSKMQMVSPASKNKTSCDEESFHNLKNDLNDFKNRTAEYIEAYQESKFYSPSFKKLKNDSRLGFAVEKLSYAPGTLEWAQEKNNSVCSSDISALIYSDFTGDNTALEKIEETKKQKLSYSNLAHYFNTTDDYDSVYRENVWKSIVLEKFSKQNNELSVYVTNKQYYNRNRPWQQINVDGVLKNKKNDFGILQVETEKDSLVLGDQVPLGAKAKALYCMNTSGFKYGLVSVLSGNDNLKTFELKDSDEVFPGAKVNIKEYIENRVAPWFYNLKSLRK